MSDECELGHPRTDVATRAQNGQAPHAATTARRMIWHELVICDGRLTSPRERGISVIARISQPRLNFGVRVIGFAGFAACVSSTGASVAAAGVSTSNTALQPSLRD